MSSSSIDLSSMSGGSVPTISSELDFTATITQEIKTKDKGKKISSKRFKTFIDNDPTSTATELQKSISYAKEAKYKIYPFIIPGVSGTTKNGKPCVMSSINFPGKSILLIEKLRFYIAGAYARTNNCKVTDVHIKLEDAVSIQGCTVTFLAPSGTIDGLMGMINYLIESPETRKFFHFHFSFMIKKCYAAQYWNALQNKIETSIRQKLKMKASDEVHNFNVWNWEKGVVVEFTLPIFYRQECINTKWAQFFMEDKATRYFYGRSMKIPILNKQCDPAQASPLILDVFGHVTGSIDPSAVKVVVKNELSRILVNITFPRFYFKSSMEQDLHDRLMALILMNPHIFIKSQGQQQQINVTQDIMTFADMKVIASEEMKSTASTTSTEIARREEEERKKNKKKKKKEKKREAESTKKKKKKKKKKGK